MRVTKLQQALTVAACATVCVGFSASTASAGEITGKGKSLKVVATGNPDSPFTLHGKSICAFSGLNDEYVLAQLNDDPSDDDLYPRVQTAAEAPPGLVGFACNASGKRGFE